MAISMTPTLSRLLVVFLSYVVVFSFPYTSNLDRRRLTQFEIPSDSFTPAPTPPPNLDCGPEERRVNVRCGGLGSDNTTNRIPSCENGLQWNDTIFSKFYTCVGVPGGLSEAVPRSNATCYAGAIVPYCELDLMIQFERPNGPASYARCTASDCTFAGWGFECKDFLCECVSCVGGAEAVFKLLSGDVQINCDDEGLCKLQGSTIPVVIDLRCSGGDCLGEAIPRPIEVEYAMSPSIIAALSLLAAAAVTILVFCLVLRVHGPGWSSISQSAETEIDTVGVTGLMYSVNGKQILKGVNVTVKRGQVLAVMGPSGSGKTSFLDALVSRKSMGQVMAAISVNGEVLPPQRSLESGYVLQDECFIGCLTVRESLKYSALLRNPPVRGTNHYDEVVERTLVELGLSDVADSRVGDSEIRGLSGGERRRLAIGMELVTSPRVLVLDEPTTGLDSKTAAEVVGLLHRLATEGNRIVICSIHQPSSRAFAKLDQLLLLSNGCAVYSGPAADVDQYLTRASIPCPHGYSMAEYLLDIASDPEKCAVLRQATEKQGLSSSDLSTEDAAVSVRKALHQRPMANLDSQLIVLLSYGFKRLYREPFLLRVHMGISLIVGVLIGIFYFDLELNLRGMQNRLGGFFFILAYLGFSSMSAVDIFVKDRLQFVRERAAGYYSTLPFFVSKMVMDILPLRVIPVLFFSCISYWMMGLHSSGERFVLYMLVLVLASVVSSALCVVVAMVARTVATAILVASLLILLFLLFGGLLINNSPMPWYMEWIRRISFFNYAFENLTVNEFRLQSFLFDPVGGLPPIDVNGQVILDNFNMHYENFDPNMWVLFGLLAIYWLLSYILLRFYVKEHR